MGKQQEEENLLDLSNKELKEKIEETFKLLPHSPYVPENIQIAARLSMLLTEASRRIIQAQKKIVSSQRKDAKQFASKAQKYNRVALWVASIAIVAAILSGFFAWQANRVSRDWQNEQIPLLQEINFNLSE